MSQTISEIESNEYHLQDLIRNQTSILDATLNIMKSEEIAIGQKFQQLELHVAQVNDRISTVVTEFQQERLSQAFNSINLLASFSTSDSIQTQTSILEVLADTHHGKISPRLITPVQLHQELVKIKSVLPHTLRLPIPQENMLNYFKVMTIEGRIIRHHALFKLSILLSSLEDFELLKITTVPFLVNNMFFKFKASSSFLIVNLYRDQFYPLNEQELHACMIIAKGKHLCKQRHLIFRRGFNSSTCEMDVLNHVHHPPSCETIQIGDGPHWIQLYTRNQWIYAFGKKTTIDVICGDNITQYNIENSGILEIQDKCLIRQPLITIQSHNTYPSSARLSFTPSSNLTTFILKNYTNNLTLIQPLRERPT